jgi:tRNA (guanosine-2'-O-)-methyltransferase
MPWDDPWTAEGVIESLEPLVNIERREKLLQVIDDRLGSVAVLMDAPHDPHNGAAVVRSCDAFGVQEIHVVEREERFLVARKITAGTYRWVDVLRYQDAEEAVEHLLSRGFELVAAHAQGELLPEQLSEIERVALVLGNEHDGISRALRSAAPRSVRIPMRGFAESLNVSVSAAVLLAHATRGRRGDLSENERRLLYAKGLFQSAARARDVLSALADDRPR